MATSAGTQKQSTLARQADSFIEDKLNQARRRIRALDLLAALLGLVAGVLAFGVLMVLLDHGFTLPAFVRTIAFVAFTVAAGVYVGFTIVRPLRRQINPYYAARKVEETLPGAKNSVVSWLDLHEDEKLPGPIHSAVSQKAARDLNKANLDAAISGKRAGWAGAVAGGLFALVLIVLFSLEGPMFFSHLRRTFLPFSVAGPAKRTNLDILEPEGLDVTVSANQPLTFRVAVEGRRPDSVRLITWAKPGDVETLRPMEEDGSAPGQWFVFVPGPEIKGDFYYRIAGGDAETEEHRVTIRSSPMIDADRFVATYKARAYTGQKVPRVQRRIRELSDLRGTEVTLDVATNRKLKNGRLEVRGDDGKTKTYQADLVNNAPERMRFSFVLEQTGRYAIYFNSTDGESYGDALPFRVTVRPDMPPKPVVLTKPGQNVALAINDLLELEGNAHDDIGVQSLVLRMKIKDGETLQAQPYRSDAELKLADGGYPLVVDYKDNVDLTTLKDSQGKPFAVKPNMVLEYWLEARDACDFPEPGVNVSESKHYEARITERKVDEKKKQEQKQQADKQKKEHQQKQDDKLKQENEQRRDEEKKEKERQEQERKDEEQREKDEKNAKDRKGEPDKPQNNQGDKQSEEQKRKDEQAREDAKRAEDEAKKREEQKQRDEQKAQPKPEKDDKGEGKDDPKKQDGKQGEGKGKPDNQPEPGKDGAKDAGKQDGKQGEGKKDEKQQGDKSGQQKDGQAQQGEKKSEGKDAGQGQQPQQNAEAKAKPDEGKQGGQGEGKKPPQPETGKPEQNQGEGKKDGPMQQGQQAGQTKDGPKPGDQQKGAEAKGNPGKQDKQQQQAQRGECKGCEKGQGEKAGGEKGGEGAQGQQSEAARGKDGGQQPMAGEQKTAQGKDDPKKGQQAQGKDAGKDGQTQASGKGGPKEGDPMAGKQGGGKDGPKDGQEKTASAKQDRLQGDPKAAQKPADQASKDDVAEAARDLKSDNPGDREAARQRLEDIARNSPDNDTREAAGKELDKDRKGSESAGAKQGGDKKDGQAQAKGGASADGEKKSEGKDGGQAKDQAVAKGGKDEQKQDGSAKGAAPGEKEARDFAKQASDARKETDAQKQKEAEERAAKTFKQMVDDLKSEDAKRREQAENFLRELSRQAREDRDVKETAGKKALPQAVKDSLDQLKKDLKSEDAQKQQGAKNALEQLNKFAQDNRDAVPQDDQKKLEEGAKAASQVRTGTYGKGEQGKITDPTKPDPSAPDGRHREHAANLVLQRFEEAVKKKTLPADMTPERIDNTRRWLKEQVDKAKVEDELVSREGGKALGTTDIDKVKGGGTARDITGNDAGTVPPEYRDLIREFTREFNKSQSEPRKDK